MGFYIDGTPVEQIETIVNTIMSNIHEKAAELTIHDLNIKKGESIFILEGFETIDKDSRSCGYEDSISIYGIQIYTEEEQLNEIFLSLELKEKALDQLMERGFTILFEVFCCRDLFNSDFDEEIENINAMFEKIKQDFTHVYRGESLKFIYENELEYIKMYQNSPIFHAINIEMVAKDYLEKFIHESKMFDPFLHSLCYSLCLDLEGVNKNIRLLMPTENH